MKKINYPKKFEEFLEANKAFDEFIGEVMANPTGVESLETVYDNTSPVSYISCAFTWFISPQGGHYWHELENKWHKTL